MWGHHAPNIDSWADNVFTYFKRCQLATNLGGAALSLDAVIRTLRQIDEAHFQRLSESLNVEQVIFAGFENHPKWGGVYRLECANAYLSCRAKGQTVAIHRPEQRPQPLTTGELVSLCHALLALVTPESYDRTGKLGREMTLEAIQHRNRLIPHLTAALQQLQ
eukprot:5063498-Amphidinium_carterae.1